MTTPLEHCRFGEIAHDWAEIQSTERGRLLHLFGKRHPLGVCQLRGQATCSTALDSGNSTGGWPSADTTCRGVARIQTLSNPPAYKHPLIQQIGVVLVRNRGLNCAL